MGRQWLANIGKTDSGVVSVSSLWADEKTYWPINFEPYTPRTTSGAARTTRSLSMVVEKCRCVVVEKCRSQTVTWPQSLASGSASPPSFSMISNLPRSL